MNNTKKAYEFPTMQMIVLLSEDILTASGNTANDGGFFSEEDSLGFEN